MSPEPEERSMSPPAESPPGKVDKVDLEVVTPPRASVPMTPPPQAAPAPAPAPKVSPRTSTP